MPLDFPATRTAAMERLARFVPRAGRGYAAQRHFDLGADSGHPHVSGLSPWLRHRVLREDEVLHAVLGRHSPQAADKFVQEVFWRTYWKGWLELRPTLWADYKATLLAAHDARARTPQLHDQWQQACAGATGIACFDAWAQELTATGYMHNHARMWFASIWIFTLRLPWQLGADFFLRHLLDGDPAVNTLSWRWVAGMQTRGKSYLARRDNIARYTDARFDPDGLAPQAPPLPCPPHPPAGPPPQGDQLDPSLRSGLLLTEEDLSPGYLFDRGLAPVASAVLLSDHRRAPIAVSERVTGFSQALAQDCCTRWAARMGPTQAPTRRADAILGWARAHNLHQVVTPYAPVGPAAQALDWLAPRLASVGIALRRILRPFDARAWPHATHGFFRFRDQIPDLLAALD